MMGNKAHREVKRCGKVPKFDASIYPKKQEKPQWNGKQSPTAPKSKRPASRP